MTDGAPSSRALSGELLRFLIAGGGAVVTDFSVYFALLWLWPVLSPSVAKSISFVVGAGVSFLLNRQFVFRAEGSAASQAGSFALLYLVTLGLNTAANAAALKLGAPKVLAWFVATGTSTVSNYLGMKLVVFRRKAL
jgi:putative flippase GtrA